MTVVWTEDALQAYDSVLEYTAECFGMQQVVKIRREIESHINSLHVFSALGIREVIWSETLCADIRSIIIKHVIKIIYVREEDTCTILAVWDVRRDPNTLFDLLQRNMQ